jgi:hypothetical protein
MLWIHGARLVISWFEIWIGVTADTLPSAGSSEARALIHRG